MDTTHVTLPSEFIDIMIACDIVSFEERSTADTTLLRCESRKCLLVMLNFEFKYDDICRVATQCHVPRAVDEFCVTARDIRSTKVIFDNAGVTNPQGWLEKVEAMF